MLFMKSEPDTAAPIIRTESGESLGFQYQVLLESIESRVFRVSSIRSMTGVSDWILVSGTVRSPFFILP